MSRITVVGSVNLDLVARAPHLPQPGETVTGADLERHPGGKGANQALAAHRLGAEVSLVARVGEDVFADEALTLLRAEGVDLTAVEARPGAPTGIALIVVAADGENQIVVAPGANRLLDAGEVDVAGAEAVVCQLEVPIEAVAAAVETAMGLVCINAAPAAAVPPALLQRADVVVVNETEHRVLADGLSACRGLVVTTLGAAGAVAHRGGHEVARAGPPAVEAVDTVGAGDAFVAALVVALLEGRGEADALGWACAAGAAATSRPGAQPSLPTREEVEEVMGP